MRQYDFDLYNKTIAALYRAGTEPETWQPFLEYFRQLMSAESVALALGDPLRGGKTLLCSSAGLNAIEGPELTSNIQKSPFTSVPAGEVVSLSQLMPASQLVDSPFYSESLKPFNIHYMLGANLWSEDRQLAYFRLMRSRQDSAFTDRETFFCEKLLPHLEQALVSYQRSYLNSLNQILWQSQLAARGWGELVLDHSGKILRLSPVAADLLKQADSPLFQHQNQLKAHRVDIQQQLRKKLERLLERDGHSIMRLTDQCGHQSWQLLMQAKISAETKYILAYLNPENSLPSLSSQTLQQLFDFTPAESTVVIALAQGQSPDEIAHEKGLSINTVRSHIRIAMAKADTNRQARLVSKVLNSLALI